MSGRRSRPIDASMSWSSTITWTMPRLAGLGTRAWRGPTMPRRISSVKRSLNPGYGGLPGSTTTMRSDSSRTESLKLRHVGMALVFSVAMVTLAPSSLLGGIRGGGGTRRCGVAASSLGGWGSGVQLRQDRVHQRDRLQVVARLGHLAVAAGQVHD